MSVSIDSICNNYGVKKLDPSIPADKKKEIVKLNDLHSFVVLLEQVEYTKARMSKRGGELSEKGVEVYVKHLKTAAPNDNAMATMVAVLSDIVNTEADLDDEDKKVFKAMLFDANELHKFFQALDISDEKGALYVQMEASTPESSLTLKVERAVKQMVGILAQGLPAAYKTWIEIDANWVDNLIEEETYAQVKTQLGSLFKTECRKFRLKEKAPKPEIGPEPGPEPKVELFQYRLMLKPVYGLTLPQKEHALGLQGSAGAQFNFSEKLNLQLDYSGDLFVPYDFSSANQGRDAASVLLGINLDHEKIDSVNPQLNFLRDKNYQLGTEEYLGGAGVGISLMDGLLYPFAGGLFGTSFGGYAGIDVVLNSEHNLSLYADYSTAWGLESALGYAYTADKWAVGAQAFYANDFDSTQKVGGTVAGRYTLANFLKNDLSLQPSVTVAQAIGDESATDLIFGLNLVFGQMGAAKPLTLKPFLYDLPNGGSSE